MSKAFDPDAYLARGQAFDPDKYLAERGKEESDLGAAKRIGKSALKGAEQGATLGFADEMGAGLQSNMANWMNLLPTSVGRLVVDNYQGQPIDPVRTYRDARGENRQIYENAREAAPEAFLAGEVAGGLVVPIPGGQVAQGAKLLTRAGNAAKQGAAFGAAYGLGASEADVTRGEAGRAALDTGLGAALGAAGGAVGEGLVSGVNAARGKLLKRATEKVRRADSQMDELADKKLAERDSKVSGELGGVSQRMNRRMENLERKEANGTLTKSDKIELEEMRASGDWAKFSDKTTRNDLRGLPEDYRKANALEETIATNAKNRQQDWDAARREAASPMAQVAPRLKRYAAPVGAMIGGSAVGAGLGLATGGSPFEIGVSALAGAGARPAAHSIRRMIQHPAFQRPIFSALEKAASRSIPQAAGRLQGRGASVMTPEVRSALPLSVVPEWAMTEEEKRLQKMRAMAQALSGSR